MIELPDFSPLRATATSLAPTRAALDRLDHLLFIAPHGDHAALARLPHGKPLAALLARARRSDDDFASSRAPNERGTGITVGAFNAARGFGALTWAAKVIREILRDKPRSLGIVLAGLAESDEAAAIESLLAAAGAAAFALPAFKSERAPKRALERAYIRRARPHRSCRRASTDVGQQRRALVHRATAERLDDGGLSQIDRRVAKARGITAQYFGERELKRLKAGAFLAVASGNATRDAGILHLRYRPARRLGPSLALVGKGIIFDTGGTNLKPFLGMLDMHMDMQGSAVALGTLLALAELRVPFGVDAWLAITENRLGADAYKPQDLVTALNGTTIQVIHTDAEGRMVLADTLALAARDKPAVIIDYATLTGSCEVALTGRYSGIFANRSAANELFRRAGVESGERVWPFPMDDDYDELLKSDVADVKQCSAESAGDHILGARFLSRFVPKSIPWVHVDLSAGQHKGGLAHVPTEITGFGVRLTVELLTRTTSGVGDLEEAQRMSHDEAEAPVQETQTSPIAARFRGFMPVIVDVETGGFNCATDALLEIAAVFVRFNAAGDLEPGAHHRYIVKPFEGSRLDPASLQVTGIDPFHPLRPAIDEAEALRSLFQEVRKELKPTGCTRAVLVGHNSFFDLQFLNAAVERTGIKRNPFHPFSSFDTATLAGVAFGQTVLSRAVTAAGFEWHDDRAHSALYDAEMTARLFCTVVNRFRSVYER